MDGGDVADGTRGPRMDLGLREAEEIGPGRWMTEAGWAAKRYSLGFVGIIQLAYIIMVCAVPALIPFILVQSSIKEITLKPTPVHKAIHNESFIGCFMALISLPHQQFE
jgi:hypothetical protein